MFLKIKDKLIALNQISIVKLDTETKNIYIYLVNNEYFTFGTKVKDKSCELNTPSFEKLVEFFETGEYEGCSTTIDILNPLKS